MILRIKGFQLEIKIEENTVTTLAILNKRVLNSVIFNLFDEIRGNDDNEIILEEDGKQVNVAKDVLCIMDYFNLDFKEKHLITAIYKYIESVIINDYGLKLDIEEVCQALGKHLYMASQDLDFGLVYDNSLSIPTILKLFDFSIDTDECQTVLERLLLFIDIYAFLQLKKVIIFINMKSFFDIEDIENIYQYLLYKKVRFVCIESNIYDRINIENSYVIDEDLIEFDYSK